VRQRFCPFKAIWAVTLLPIVAWAAPKPVISTPTSAKPILILVSIDGYRADYLDRGHSPVLAELADDGVHATGLRPVYPSVTYPNHYTIVTGLYPDKHGVVNNTMHDPVLGDFSPPNRTANTDGRWWAQAEPLWVTAQKQGRLTASVFWPGTQAEIGGVRPSYWKLFDSAVQPDARVDQVLEWLDLPSPERPTFISLYLEQADVAGHSYGPDSLQVDEALVTIDTALGRLVEGLRQRKLYDTTNLVIVSDHGMSASSPDRVIYLDQIVNMEHVTLAGAIVNVALDPKPGFETEVESALLSPHPHMSCWKKTHIPQKFHYGNNKRIPAIHCLADDGWMVSTAAVEARRVRPPLGEHGYDNDGPKMRALFVAHGPSFKQHVTVPVVDMINVYPLLTRLIGVTARPNDGNPAATAGMLKMIALPSRR